MIISFDTATMPPRLHGKIWELASEVRRAEQEAFEQQEAPGKKALVEGDFRVPHGTKLRKSYHNKVYEAEIDDGAIVFEGERYHEFRPIQLLIKERAAVDYITSPGWFWKYQDEDGEWTDIRHLKK
jgi:hypothetical protein